MSGCTDLSQHTIWISNNFPGVFSLPKAVSIDSLYVGDVYYEDTTASIARGTLTDISLPALTTVFEISAVDLDSLASIEMPNVLGASNGFMLTLTGLPNLKNITFGANFAAEYVNITNTGLTKFNWPSTQNVFHMTLSGNPSLTEITFADGANLTYLSINCGDDVPSQATGRPMPRLTGPTTIRELEVSFCDQPAGDWASALDGLGSTSAGMLSFHDNVFTGLQISNATTLEDLEVHDNYNLAEIAFPNLMTAGKILVKNNAQLAYLNTTTFPTLSNVSGAFELDGNFNS
jgi:hypothetical protein